MTKIPRLSHNKHQKIILIDAETEGLSLHLHRPWQMAYSIWRDGKILKSRDLYPWYPDLDVNRRAAEITGFDWNVYREKAIDKELVWKEIAEYLYDDEFLVAGHNVIGFDFYMIKRLGLDSGDWRGFDFSERTLDTLCLSRMLHQGTRPDLNNFFGSQLKEIGRPPRGSKKATLSAMADHFRVDYDKTKLHDASYDLFLNAQVMEKLIYALDI